MAQEETSPPLRVLLIDPMMGTQVTTRQVLEALGHEVVPASHWTEAERLLQRTAFGAVVMAFDAAGLDGRGAARSLRGRLPPAAELPLVGTTSGLRHGEERDAFDAGFDRLVVRPMAADDLAEALRLAIRDRTPVPPLDTARRAALRASHGPAALAAADDLAMDAPARLLTPLFAEGGGAAEYAAAGEAVATAMEHVGAVVAAARARALVENAAEGSRYLRPLMSAVVAARVALRHDRMTAARADPIWAASDTSSGDTP